MTHILFCISKCPDKSLASSIPKILISYLDDMNWNALEWDRAAEELTWERVSKTYIFQLSCLLLVISYPGPSRAALPQKGSGKQTGVTDVTTGLLGLSGLGFLF